jgi:uncharacterized protein YbjQ (UPF0145 family)
VYCSFCGERLTIYGPFTRLKGEPCCQRCIEEYYAGALGEVFITRDYRIDNHGYRVKEVISDGDIEILISANIAFELFNSSPENIEEILQKVVYDNMKIEAIKRGANAVIDVRFHCEKFTKQEIRIAARGTFVMTESIFVL